MTGRIGLLLALAGPLTVWAVHFVLVYALISAGCASRAILSMGAMTALVVVSTLIALALAALPLLRPPTKGDGDLRQATRWISAIATAAVIYNALPFVFASSCGG